MLPELQIILIASAIIILAGFTHGFAGFGFSLVSVPLLIIFLSPKIVVPILIVHSFFINLYLAYSCRKNAEMNRVLPLFIFGIIGTVIGAKILLFLAVNPLKIFISITISVIALAYLIGFRKNIKNEKKAYAPVGILSGILNGSISMSGPPLIFFFTNQGVKKQIFRANLLTYFLFINIITIPIYIIDGLLTEEALSLSAALLPALIIGAVAGNAFSHLLPERIFRRIILVVVMLSGIASFVLTVI
jgi:uncharacterized membrane protein YfcA